MTNSSPKLVPTEEQEAIIAFAKNDTRSLLINALAGAAKTSTLEMIVTRLYSTPTLMLAFNKRIAEELKLRMPGHVKCQTLNALGHQVWADAIKPRRVKLAARKNADVINAIAEEYPKDDQPYFKANFGALCDALRHAKARGWVPDYEDGDRGNIAYKSLISTEDFWDSFDHEVSDFGREVVTSAMRRTIDLSYEGVIDFDDQIYMPTLFGGTFPNFPLVLVDEAQDLSPLNHAMLRRLARKRLIAVGDPWQSIYGFRGAALSGMDTLKTMFSMESLELSTTFRCPQSIVRRAWFRVPHMRWAPWAQEGAVHELTQWSTSTILDGGAIICRNNAPLFKCAFALIRGGRGVTLVGSDIGVSLVKTLRSLSRDENILQAELLLLIDRWLTKQRKSSKAKASLEDKAECLRIFAAQAPTLRGAVSYAEKLFASQGSILLMSGHKSKGLEFDVVYHLDPWRIPSEYAKGEDELAQEYNVRYVIETRAKRELYLINMEDFHA